ncbi:restriction endonuclease subunit S [Ruegeria sp. HKCCD7318]|uniref:restriction endonuclease subunit S n=1 Tax=Ruegeria sp. HKCCD7318 TaxID=2683014 RepID=UPI0014911204|nr:restriction endonuclease subunit S [Ruegeria sp. HKCCD7318]NOE32300.1 restriction endonuclease subunit S [Ruegeria sp. HKCCD7318]
MNAELLLRHYEQICDAHDAVDRLRQFVLDLAVRGKLIAQRTHEVPQDVGFAHNEATAPYSLPENWRWTKIGDQLELLNGMAFKPTDWAHAGLRIVRIQNLNNPEAKFNLCDPKMARERSLIDDGSFLISWSGTPGTSFGAFIWDRGPAVLNQHIFRCDFKTEAYIADFLKLAVNGRLDEMISKAHGGVGLRHITKGKLQAMLIALPPLAEQHRIVAKVDELMALCDQFEEARSSHEATRDNLTTASLARLTDAESTEEEFRDNARFALGELPSITHRQDQIKGISKAILDLAVRGKLVQQDPNDEPASEIAKRISREKTEMIKNGQLPNSKTMPSIGEHEGQFNLKKGWEWVRLGELTQFVTSGSRDWAKYYSKEGAIFLRMGNLSKDHYRLRMDSVQRVNPPSNSEGKRTKLQTGDVLISITGDVGMLGLIPEDFGEAYINQHTAMIRPMPEMLGRYLPELFRTPFAKAQFNAPQRGVKNSFRLSDVTQFVVPLPPLAEQKRIVAKIDELMGICDQLEASLRTAETTRAKLLEATLREALEPAQHTLEAAE